MQHVIYVGGANICLNAACRQTEEDLNMAHRQPLGPLKHSMLLAAVGILYRRENTFWKGPGSLPCTEHWITFSLSYSSQGHMSSAHCAAGDLSVLPVCLSVVVTYTSHINEQWGQTISFTPCNFNDFHWTTCILSWRKCFLHKHATHVVKIASLTESLRT